VPPSFNCFPFPIFLLLSALHELSFDQLLFFAQRYRLPPTAVGTLFWAFLARFPGAKQAWSAFFRSFLLPSPGGSLFPLDSSPRFLKSYNQQIRNLIVYSGPGVPLFSSLHRFTFPFLSALLSHQVFVRKVMAVLAGSLFFMALPPFYFPAAPIPDPTSSLRTCRPSSTSRRTETPGPPAPNSSRPESQIFLGVFTIPIFGRPPKPRTSRPA